jgi:C-terminal processing protease CtpA/Prc
MANEIEISLFKLLDEVSEILEAKKNVEDEEQRILNFHKIEENLEAFLENFFLQLFNNGFDLDIQGINEEALADIENNIKDSDSPKNVVDSFRSAIEELTDIETAVYLDPPREEDLYDAYLNFLPSLFESFTNDEVVLRSRIENYASIRVRMEGILTKIGILKKQKLLS